MADYDNNFDDQLRKNFEKVFGPMNSYKSRDDIRDDEVTDKVDKIWWAFEAVLAASNIKTNTKEDDEIREVLFKAVDRSIDE